MKKDRRHARICELVLEALDLPASERDTFLVRECGSDVQLRSEIEALLAHESHESEFLARPVVDFFATPTPGPSPGPDPALPVGRVATLTFDSVAPLGPSTDTPKAIRHYEIVKEIGRGGMGVVYQGRDTKLDRPVAIKAIHWDRATDAERRERFRQEARLLAALDHPNIGAIYSFEETDDGHFLILEFVKGQTLGQLVGEGALAIDRMTRIAEQVAHALQAAHERGIVHRDLSPGNVMVREDGVAKVLDFGLARSAGVVTGTRTLSSGPIAGTPSFMSPELLRGAPSSRAADSWAFACLLYEGLTGERAFLAPTLAGIFDAILHGKPELDRLPEATPPGVHEVLERCWVKEPQHRLDDMGRIRELLAGSSSDPSSVSIAATAERWSSCWQPLAPRIPIGDRIPMRLFLENPEARDIDVVAKVEAIDGWKVYDDSKIETTIKAKGTFERLIHVSADRAGRRRLPSLDLQLCGRSRTLVPVPSQVDVETAQRAPLFGREDEVAQIGQWLDNLRRSPGLLWTIAGPEGSGRSALLAETAQRAGDQGVRVVSGTGHSGLSEPLELLLDLVRSFLGVFEPIRDRDPRLDFARGRLREYLGDSSPATQYFMDLLRGAEAEVLDDNMQRYRSYQLFSSSAADAPTLFLIDDFERADPRSVDLFAAILRRARADGLPLAAIVTRHGGDAEAEDDGLRSAETLTLGPLDPTAIDELVEEYFPGANHRDYLPELAAQVLEHSGGQPGPIRETLRALGRDRDPDALFRASPDGWQVNPRLDLERRLAAIPTGYGALLEERLLSVAERSQTVLEIAALCGVEFPVAPLEALIESEAELDDALDDLETSGVIEPARSDLTRYRFTYPSLVHQAVAGIDKRGSRRAARLKRQVAGALIEHFTQDRGSAKDSEELGLRLIELGEQQLALPHLLVALGRRVKKRQIPEARRIVQRIDELEGSSPIDDPATRYEWLFLKGKALTFAGQLDAAKGAAEEARRLAERAGDRAGGLLCGVLLAEVAIRRGRFEAGRDIAHATRQAALEQKLDWIASEAGRNLAISYRRLGERSQAQAIWRQDLEQAIAGGDKIGEIRGQNNLGIVDYELSDWERAEERFHRAVEIAQELDHPEFEMIARVWIANIAFQRGELDRAREDYSQAIDTFQSLQNRRALSRNYYNRGLVQCLLGRFDDAAKDLDRACALCRELGDAHTELRYRLDAAGVAFDGGDLQGAKSELARATDLEGEISKTDLLRRLRFALLELEFEKPERAWEILAEFDTNGGYRSESYRGLDPTARLLMLTLLSKLRRELAHDPDFSARARNALLETRTFVDIRERVQLAVSVVAEELDRDDWAPVEALIGENLEDSKLAVWATSAIR